MSYCPIFQIICDHMMVLPVLVESFDEHFCFFACPISSNSSLIFKWTKNVTIRMMFVFFHLLKKPIKVTSCLMFISCPNCWCNQFVVFAVLLNSFHANFMLFGCPVGFWTFCRYFFSLSDFLCLRIYLCLSSCLQAACLKMAYRCCSWCV